MDASQRRESIIAALKKEHTPFSASKLAEKFGVSRQVIVGDVSLLRAAGIDIIATPRGYLLESTAKSQNANKQFVGKIVCQHTASQTEDELYTVVDNGGELLDVIVEHPIYGELAGRLNIASRKDADQFMRRVAETETGLLSDLTNGIHLHTIACEDRETFETIKKLLQELDIVYND
ncbi:transcription repressor NadR [Desemzia sp. RIT804]|uniref:transcription repressor NadR n=1 Tax=Desemzia sp. RIT 804 TaxID=2810209 RepID=UPI00195131AA|nr:transcription repressor NadR [Desemzia sp. RIT 804]MBM6613862.1 transcription repressor NadR [Desemzia sp. RIT 804]